MLSDEVQRAIVALGLGGVLLKVVEKLLGRKELRMADDVAIRQELRAEVKALNARIDKERAESQSRMDKQELENRERMDKMQTEIDRWKGKYYQLLGQYVEMVGRLKRIPELRESIDFIAVQDAMRDLDPAHPRSDPASDLIDGAD